MYHHFYDRLSVADEDVNIDEEFDKMRHDIILVSNHFLAISTRRFQSMPYSKWMDTRVFCAGIFDEVFTVPSTPVLSTPYFFRFIFSQLIKPCIYFSSLQISRIKHKASMDCVEEDSDSPTSSPSRAVSSRRVNQPASCVETECSEVSTDSDDSKKRKLSSPDDDETPPAKESKSSQDAFEFSGFVNDIFY